MATSQNDLTVDEVIQAWTADTDKMERETPEGVWRGMTFSSHALRLLAQGEPVSAHQLAEVSGLPITDVQETFAKINEQGGEVDGSGNLVGLALTLNPTPHRFFIDGRTLYTWCALDAVFLPGLLGQTAKIESLCPTTGASIELTISPEGIEEFTPTSTVISVAVPGVSCRREDDDPTKPKTGPVSDGCSQMHFFANRGAAELWLQSHPGTFVFSVDDAYKLAYVNWISRRNTLDLQSSNNLDSQPIGCCC